MARKTFDSASAGRALYSATITAAGTAIGGTVTGLAGAKHAVIQAAFDHGSGGTSAKFYVQNSLDGTTNWYDVACFAFTTADATRLAAVSHSGGTALITPTDGSLTDSSALAVVPLGDAWRVKQITTGTYADATTIAIHLVTKG